MSREYYKEKHYLKDDKESLEILNRLRLENISIQEEEYEKYEQLMYLYDLYISEIAYFIKELEITSPIGVSLAISHLISNGYLSNDHIYKKIEAKEELDINYGLSIIFGKGCCRNSVGLQNDIMKKLKYSIKKLYCYQEREIIKQGKLKKANHVINAIYQDNNLYGIDIYNNDKLYSFKTEFLLKEITEKEPYFLTYKPYYEIIMNDSDIEGIKENLKRLSIISKKKTILPITYEDIIKNSINNYLNKNEKLENFHNKTKILRKDITKEFYK